MGPTEDSFRPFGHGVPAGEIEQGPIPFAPTRPKFPFVHWGISPSPATSTATRRYGTHSWAPARPPSQHVRQADLLRAGFRSAWRRTVRIKAGYQGLHLAALADELLAFGRQEVHQVQPPGVLTVSLVPTPNTTIDAPKANCLSDDFEFYDRGNGARGPCCPGFSFLFAPGARVSCAKISFSTCAPPHSIPPLPCWIRVSNISVSQPPSRLRRSQYGPCASISLSIKPFATSTLPGWEVPRTRKSCEPPRQFLWLQLVPRFHRRASSWLSHGFNPYLAWKPTEVACSACADSRLTV